MRLLASDYDGTLRLGARVASDTVAAVQRFQQSGHRFALVTGRGLNMIEEEILANGIRPDLILSSNGALISDSSGCWRRQFPIDQATALALMDYLRQQEILGFVACGGRQMSFAAIRPVSADPRMAERMRRYQAWAVPEEQLRRQGPIFSLAVWMDDRQRMKELAFDLERRFALNCFINRGTLDIVAHGVSKKTGVQAAAELLGCDRVAVIGDDYNDLPMITGFHGFAMESGVDEVKQGASRLFASVEECVDWLLRQDQA